MSIQALMDLFKFDQADLKANQQGHLSPGQQARWQEAGQWANTTLQKIVPPSLAGLIAVIGIALSVGTASPVSGIVVSLIVALLVSSVSWLLIRRNGRSEPESLLAVGRAEGNAHLREYTDRSDNDVRHYYRLEIEHHSFQLFKKQQFEALKNGARYAVYYLDNDDKYILSLEQLNQE